MERIKKLYLLVGAVIAFGLFFTIAAYASESDQATTVTFSAPVEVSGHVLPAGTYLFKVQEDDADPNLVQIFNADGTKLYASVPTVPTDRLQPTGNTTVTLADQGAGQPDALLKWFYPGELTGHQFLYSGREEKALAQARHETVTPKPDTGKSEVQAGE